MGGEQYSGVIQGEPRLAALQTDNQARFAKLLHLLLQGQKRTNLTAITDPAAVARLHFADSISTLEMGTVVSEARVAADVGSGAGFPLLPLAMLMPECTWTAIESVGKKVRFITETAQELNLRNVRAEHMRAEEAGRGALREAFDLVTARAVGPVVSLCEVGLPLLKLGGSLILMKTESVISELEAAEGAIRKLGGQVGEHHRYRLDRDDQDRLLLQILKKEPTPPEYPRLPGVPFKKPLK